MAIGMRRPDYRKLREIYDTQGAERLKSVMQDAFNQKLMHHSEFSLRELAEQTVDYGSDWVRSMQPGKGQVLQEAGAVNSAAFATITGQVYYNAVLEGYQDEEFVFSKLIPSTNTNILQGEKVAGLSRIGDEAEIVDESQPYPLVGFGEDWIQTPASVKRGMICAITAEAITADTTGKILDHGKEVGYWLGVNKEKRAIDTIIDENTTTGRLNWRGTSYATYQSSTPWINISASTALVDWTDVEAVKILFSNMTDPWTGEPIVIGRTGLKLICTDALEFTALRIRNATEITVVTPGYATTANPTETRVANPVQGMFDVVSSAQLAARLATDTSWFLGKPERAFRYMNVWEMSVTQAPPNSEADFERDVIFRMRARERGAFSTFNPRYMGKATA